MARRLPRIRTIDRAGTSPQDGDALDDVAASRLIDGEEMSRRLGGWALSRDAADAAAASRSERDSPAGLFWTHTAAAEWVDLHALLTALNSEAADTLAAMVVAAMVRLIVDDAALPGRITDRPLAASLALRLYDDGDRIIVLGLRGVSLVR